MRDQRAIAPRQRHGCEGLRLADQHMYSSKQTGRLSAAEQSRSVLVRVLAERQPELTAHMERVSELAGAVALRLGRFRVWLARPVSVIRADRSLPGRRTRVALGAARLQERGPDGIGSQLGRRAVVAVRAERGALRRLPILAVRSRQSLARRTIDRAGYRAHRARLPLRYLGPVLTELADRARRSPLALAAPVDLVDTFPRRGPVAHAEARAEARESLRVESSLAYTLRDLERRPISPDATDQE